MMSDFKIFGSMKTAFTFVAIFMPGMCLIGSQAFAQTVALHATQAEVDIWKQRSVSGPYLDDWNRLRSRADSFLSNPDVERWPGNQLNEAWDAAKVFNGQQPPNYHPKRTLGDKLRDAALVFQIKNDTRYRDAVLQTLLRQASTAGTDFSNSTKWSPTTTILHYEDYAIANWLRKLVYGYSYVRASLSQSDQQIIDRFFLKSATYWDLIIHNGAKVRFPYRYQDDYSKSMFQGNSRGLTHWSGYRVYNFHYAWNNIPAAHNAMVASVAVVINNATLKDHAKRFVKEWLMFCVAKDGTVCDQERWNDNGDPKKGYLYAGTAIGSIVTAVDHLARAGDTQLYEYQTSFGYYGWEGGPKSLLLVVQRFANITIGERGLGGGILLYASKDSTLTSTEIIGPGDTMVHDIYLIPANIYYQNATVKKSYTRKLPTSPWSGGYDPWGGDWGTYPGIRFMFGQLEGLVQPYDGIGQLDIERLSPPTGLRIVGQ